MDMQSDQKNGPEQNTPGDLREQRLELLIDRLPRRLQSFVRWLRRPSSRWVRIPVGVLLIAGSFLSILPVFGLWMLPLGIVLLAEDIPWLRQATWRLPDWIERHWPKRKRETDQ
jgi:hypothetical protein